MDQLRQDIRFGWRLLWRSPGFTIAAVLALALVTALAACLPPARRAAALDPLAGLRAD